jgi:hypothetical protein
VTGLRSTRAWQGAIGREMPDSWKKIVTKVAESHIFEFLTHILKLDVDCGHAPSTCMQLESSPDVQVVGRPGAGTILKLLPRALTELENSIVGPRLQM